METVAIGIDVSKKYLDLACSDRKQTTRVTNDAAGHAKVLAYVSQHPDALIVLEPTSRYHRALVHALTTAGRQPAVVNPFLIRRFAEAICKRAKSDPVDARVLAAYGLQIKPVPRPLPTESEELLALRVARRADLVKARSAEYCRRHVATDPLELTSIADTIVFLTSQVKTLEKGIREIIAADPELKRRYQILRTVPGVGFVVATVLLANLPELGRLTRKTAAALAGVAPYAKQSGATDRKRCIAGDRAVVRTHLYIMAHTALRDDDVIKTGAQHLDPKPYKVKAIAIARQMLAVINAMLRDGLTWAETDFGQGKYLPDMPLAA